VNIGEINTSISWERGHRGLTYRVVRVWVSQDFKCTPMPRSTQAVS